jgi:hypothetical protein
MRSLVALAAGLALVAGLTLPELTAAADYVQQVNIKPAQLYEKNGRPRIVLAVNNNSGEVLDIVIGCDFLDAGNAKIGTGHGSVSRLPPRRSDTVEVVDEIAQHVEAARCNVLNAQK